MSILKALHITDLIALVPVGHSEAAHDLPTMDQYILMAMIAGELVAPSVRLDDILIQRNEMARAADMPQAYAYVDRHFTMSALIEVTA